MDGMSCAEAIIRFDEHARMILLSGYDENGPSGITEAQRKLIKGYLTKPVKMHRLLDELMFALD